MGAAGGGGKHGDWQWHWIEYVPRPFRTVERFVGGVALLAGVSSVAYYMFARHLAIPEALLAGGFSALGFGVFLWIMVSNVPGFDVK